MRDRTADLLRARQALSQLSYSPIYMQLRIYNVTKSSKPRLKRFGEANSSETRLVVRTFSLLNDELHNAVSRRIGGSEWT